MSMMTSAEHEIVQEPSTTKNSSSSRAPKTGAQLRDFIADITPLLKAAHPSLMHNKTMNGI